MSTARLDRIRDADRGLKLVGGVGGVAIAVALLAFLAAPGLTLYPLLVFVGVVVVGWFVYQESTARFLMWLTTVSTVVILGLITVYLILRSLPAFSALGLDMFTGTEFGPEGYSLVPMIWGTLLTTAIAMAIAGPLGVAGAVFLAEIAPGWLRELLKPAVEVLAGVPSIVYGFLGLVVLSQYLFDEFDMPVYGSLLAVGLVVGVMALPTVISVAEDAITSVPDPMKDGALALGATDWQTIKSVTLPASFSGVSAAVILGVGRAVGETMAATVILANIAELPDPLYDVFGNTITLTSLIASQYGNASGLQMAALFAAGVVLFVTVMCLSVGSRYVEVHMERKLGGRQ
ncbi:phosphate ABC transporter permease subunit PstC [Salinirubellus sp. GCM10025818]|jgi:phosphate transport system permease protein|uniref:phosphate ABC transporter permease subunit PstC n=1 Tax=Salinirubellus TaxID=2162630 RepID=UPI0030D16A75